ncbi:MAG: polyprenyl synthetase family protein, partial [Pseudobdellovibrio sp.]
MQLDLIQNEFVLKFESWLKEYLDYSKKNKNYADILLKSQEYSLLSGGKRFRPFLAYLVFDLFSKDYSKIKNLCLSLEMIHTYSLIHDDLPCMDNDDYRRGKPTNHKVFSEDIALLAGDGLLSDVFYLLATDSALNAEVKTKLVALVSEKIGSTGMVSGQVFDMQANSQISLDQLKQIHTLKTAHLIQASALGAALAAQVNSIELHNISEFSLNLGMAFQIKDDLLDYNDNEQDFKSYLSILGHEKTQQELVKHSNEALSNLKKLAKASEALEKLIEYNLKRNS